jgi:hypothetical protein
MVPTRCRPSQAIDSLVLSLAWSMPRQPSEPAHHCH